MLSALAEAEAIACAYDRMSTRDQLLHQAMRTHDWHWPSGQNMAYRIRVCTGNGNVTKVAQASIVKIQICSMFAGRQQGRERDLLPGQQAQYAARCVKHTWLHGCTWLHVCMKPVVASQARM